MDEAALQLLGKGPCILTAVDGGRGVGCVVDTVARLSTAAPQLTVALREGNFTTGAVERSGRFALTVPTRRAPRQMLERFGLFSGAQGDKFEGLPVVEFRAMPCPAEGAAAIVVCRVKDITGAGERRLVLAQITDAALLSGKPCLTAWPGPLPESAR